MRHVSKQRLHIPVPLTQSLLLISMDQDIYRSMDETSKNFVVFFVSATKVPAKCASFFQMV